MSHTSLATLEDAIRHAGEGWMFDSSPQREHALAQILKTLESVRQEAQKRLGGNAPDISETALLREYHRNPRLVRAFFQALGVTHTPEMLLMVWRIIQGMLVREIQMNYLRQQSFQVRVILESPYGEEDEPYVSLKIDDFALFRHIGILEIAGTPVFDGFYALRVRGIN